MRPVGSSDLDLLASHRNDFDTWRNLTSTLPVWNHLQDDWLKSLGDKNMYFIGYKLHKNIPIAFLRVTDIDFINSNACIGLDIFKSQRGLGYGKPFFGLIVDYVFNTLNLHKAWLLVREDNVKAINIYDNAGFKKEGQLKEHLFREGRYHDYILMGMVK